MMSVTLILDFVLPKSETEIFDQSLDSSPSSKNLSHFLLQPFKSLSRFALNINYKITKRYNSKCLQVKNQCQVTLLDDFLIGTGNSAPLRIKTMDQTLRFKIGWIPRNSQFWGKIRKMITWVNSRISQIEPL